MSLMKVRNGEDSGLAGLVGGREGGGGGRGEEGAPALL